MKLPIYVKNCIELLEKAGFSAYAVGGAVRDSLIGVEPSDWDVTTSAHPDEILHVFKGERTIPTGIKHGTVTVLCSSDNGERLPVEITTYRIDGEYKDSRHPESVSFSNDILDDLARRDFTVNAMAFNERDGLVDGFGGIADLEQGVIRAVGDPQKRFSEDALRILRAFRFASQLGFEIEEKTLEGANACAHLLKNIARERIGVEFKKLLASSGVVYSLENMVRGGVWLELFGDFTPSPQTILGISRLDNGNFATRLSVLISEADKDYIAEFLDSLRLSNAEKKLVLRLCSIKNFEVSDNADYKCARSFLHYYRDILPMATEVLLFYHANVTEFVDIIMSESTKNRPLAISDLAVNGNDLLPLCEGNYKQMGLILNLLLERVIENPELNKKEELLVLAKEIIKRGL
jgi:tRNA nucleotidyltransferase (CCA-adding enzyme)